MSDLLTSLSVTCRQRWFMFQQFFSFFVLAANQKTEKLRTKMIVVEKKWSAATLLTLWVQKRSDWFSLWSRSLCASLSHCESTHSDTKCVLKCVCDKNKQSLSSADVIYQQTVFLHAVTWNSPVTCSTGVFIAFFLSQLAWSQILK